MEYFKAARTYNKSVCRDPRQRSAFVLEVTIVRKSDQMLVVTPVKDGKQLVLDIKHIHCAISQPYQSA